MPKILARKTTRIRRVRRTIVFSTSPSVPCPECQRDVPGVTAVEAIRLLQAREESFLDLLSAGVLHAIPTAAGATWICRDSIFRRPS